MLHVCSMYSIFIYIYLHISIYRIQKIAGWWFGTSIFWISIYWEWHHPNWRTHIFFRGFKPPTRLIIIYIYIYIIYVLCIYIIYNIYIYIIELGWIRRRSPWLVVLGSLWGSPDWEAGWIHMKLSIWVDYKDLTGIIRELIQVSKIFWYTQINPTLGASKNVDSWRVGWCPTMSSSWYQWVWRSLVSDK